MNSNDPKRVEILQTAQTLITGQRQQDYGPPTENFQRIAELWNVRLRPYLKEGKEIDGQIVAELMILLKVARAVNSPTEDTYIDIAGYAGIAGELAEGNK